MLYRRACEGMAGRPHGWGSRKVEWQGTQRNPSLIRTYNQCSWKALICLNWAKRVYGYKCVCLAECLILTEDGIFDPTLSLDALTPSSYSDKGLQNRPGNHFRGSLLSLNSEVEPWPRRRRNALKRKLSDPSCLPRVEFLRRESMSEVLLHVLPMHARSASPPTPNFNVVVFWWLAHEGTLHSAWSTLRFGGGWRRDQDSRLKNSTLCQDSIPTGCTSSIFCVCVCVSRLICGSGCCDTLCYL